MREDEGGRGRATGRGKEDRMREGIGRGKRTKEGEKARKGEGNEGGRKQRMERGEGSPGKKKRKKTWRAIYYIRIPGWNIESVIHGRPLFVIQFRVISF
jgi:hypothetical protein